MERSERAVLFETRVNLCDIESFGVTEVCAVKESWSRLLSGARGQICRGIPDLFSELTPEIWSPALASHHS